jgi:hypothetical protein
MEKKNAFRKGRRKKMDEIATACFNAQNISSMKHLLNCKLENKQQQKSKKGNKVSKI